MSLWPAGKISSGLGPGSGRACPSIISSSPWVPTACSSFPRQGPEIHIPTQAREVFDVSGAGDTVAAVMALSLARLHDPRLAATLANLAAGVVVGKVGTAPVFRAELERELGRRSTSLEDKIVSLAELSLQVAHLQAQGKKVVFTNGCFDLLHGGHIKFLEDSRRLGDALVVALDTDASVRRVKGEGRPVIGEAQRQRILAALEAVDFVTVFESDKLPEILASLKPDLLTKGSNYPEAKVAGRDTVLAYGGEVKLLPVTESVSVSDLIQRIKNGAGKPSGASLKTRAVRRCHQFFSSAWNPCRLIPFLYSAQSKNNPKLTLI